MSDAYAECYPSYHEMGAVVVESDDEDLGQMDAKVGGGLRYRMHRALDYQSMRQLML